MDDERKMWQQVMGQFGPPAFMRRANDVDAAWERLIEASRRRRDEMLRMVKITLATVRALAGVWDSLRVLDVSERTLDVLRELEQELQPELRIALSPTSS